MNTAARPPKPLRGARRPFGAVDYTFAKRALLREFRTGLVGRLDVCDAHPELLRAAKYVGHKTDKDCPVCGKESLRLLAYVYGDDLGTDHGRVWELSEALNVAAAATWSRSAHTAIGTTSPRRTRPARPPRGRGGSGSATAHPAPHPDSRRGRPTTMPADLHQTVAHLHRFSSGHLGNIG